MNYFRDSFKELSKVSWPTFQRMIQLTIFVIIFSIASAALIGAADYLLNNGYQAVVDFSIESGFNTTSGTAEPVTTSGAEPVSVEIDGSDIDGNAITISPESGEATVETTPEN